MSSIHHVASDQLFYAVLIFQTWGLFCGLFGICDLPKIGMLFWTVLSVREMCV